METASYVVTAANLSSITDSLTANAAVIVPWGLGVLAVFVGIRFIPKLVKTFTRG